MRRGGKGPLIQTDKSATLSTLQNQTVFQPIGFAYKAGSKAGSVGAEEDKAPTLYAERHDAAVVIQNHPADSRVDIDESGVVQTLTSRMGTGGGNVPMVMEMTLTETHGNAPCVVKGFGKYEIEEVSSTLRSRDCRDTSDLVVSETPPTATYQNVTGPLMANSHPGSYTGQDAFNDMLIAGVDCRNATESPEKNGTLQAKSGGGSSLNYNQVVRVCHIVRRLTPLECERLQGYPDGWTSLPQISDMTDEEYDFWKIVLFERAVRELKVRENEDGVFEIWKLTETEDENGDPVEVWENTHKPYKHKTKAQMVTWYNKMVLADSAQYKALGNSIALPPWKWVLKRLCACYERDATMASLFDGIGGFPYLWEQLNGEGSCLWASEIEEFPMAVTRLRFGG